MPDVRHEGARTSYDDALEVFCSEGGDGVGVATFAADQDWDGVPTGERDCLPVRVYVWPEDEEEPTGTAWLSIEASLARSSSVGRRGPHPRRAEHGADPPAVRQRRHGRGVGARGRARFQGRARARGP